MKAYTWSMVLLMLLVPLALAEEPADAAAATAESSADSSPPPYVRGPRTPSRFSLSTGLSYWNAKDLDDFDTKGFWGVGLIGEFQLVDYLALQLRTGIHGAGDSEDLYVEDTGWYETTATVVALPLEAGLIAILPLGERFSLYGGGGGGYYLFDGEITFERRRWRETYDLKMDDEFGVFGLVGLRFHMTRYAALFLEAKYTHVESSLREIRRSDRDRDPSGRPEARSAVDLADRDLRSSLADLDIDLSGFSVQAGLIFRF